MVGVAGATPSRGPIFTAGLAGLVAGAVSMALGEYISVSSQRDSERALLAQEKRELRETPEAELQELIGLYEAKGLTHSTASAVARELTEHDALRAHLDIELHLDPDDLANPVQAAAASALSFTLGAVLPLLAILLPPPAWRIPTTFVGVLLALGIAGTHQCSHRRQQPSPGRLAGGHRRRHRARIHLRNRPLVRRRHRLIACRLGPTLSFPRRKAEVRDEY